MYMPGRWRMCSAFCRIWTLLGSYFSEAAMVAALARSCSGVNSSRVTSVMEIPRSMAKRSLSVRVPGAGAEAQVLERGPGQALAHLLQQLAFVEVSQLLQEHR